MTTEEIKERIELKKEDLLNTKPENLESDACKIIISDPILKKEYEEKWDAEIECDTKN